MDICDIKGGVWCHGAYGLYSIRVGTAATGVLFMTHPLHQTFDDSKRFSFTDVNKSLAYC